LHRRLFLWGEGEKEVEGRLTSRGERSISKGGRGLPISFPNERSNIRKEKKGDSLMKILGRGEKCGTFNEKGGKYSLTYSDASKGEKKPRQRLRGKEGGKGGKRGAAPRRERGLGLTSACKCINLFIGGGKGRQRQEREFLLSRILGKKEEGVYRTAKRKEL